MFVLFISSTKLSLIPGLSAAGANTEALPYTAPADADMLFYDKPRVIDVVPLDPFGHPTPAIVTRAAVIEGDLPVMTVRAGTTVARKSPFTDFANEPGGDPRFAPAVKDAEAIISRSAALAGELSKKTNKFVLAESVPGGTTTALLLMRSLGYNGTVSSAGPVNPLSLKEQIWNEVSKRLDIKVGGMKGDGMRAAVEAGDPMQIAVASFVEALPQKTEVVLAGGTQMMAVAALLRDRGYKGELLVATTKYVLQDKTSCLAEYAETIGVDYYAAPLDFSKSKYEGLADYEKGFIKEGVGMGGAVWYATQRGATIDSITKRTEALYEKMIG